MAATATLISTAETHVNVASSANAVGGPNGTFAVATLPTGSSASVTTSGYGAQAAIGAPPSSIDSVAVTVHWYTSATGGQTVTAQLASGGTPFGTAQTLTPSTNSGNSETVTFTGVTWAQLADLRVLWSASTSAPRTVRLDAQTVVVNYTDNVKVATDSAAAVDAESVAATLTASDTATAVESAAVLVLLALTDSDSATASDSSSGITAAAASTDTATGADAAAVVVTFRAVSSSDAATAVESAAVASESQLRPAPRSLDETLAGSARITTTVVFLAGPAAGQSLPVIDGEVTVDDTSRVRRTCRLTVLASSEWVPTTVTHPLSLAQVSEWQIVQHLTLDDGTEMSWSQGVYHLTSPAVAHDSAGAFTITLEGADRAARAKLVGMQARWVGAAGGLVVPAVEAMLAAYCPWLPLGLTDLGHRLGGTQDMVLGEYGADLWDTAAQILTSVAGYSLHVDRDGVAVSPLILDPLADRVVAAWATGEGGMLGSLELGADITSIINEVGVPWEEPRPEGADSTWVPASGVEVAVDASSDYGTLSPVGPRRHRFQGDTSVIGSAGQAAQVATSTLVRMQGLSMTSRARVLIDPRRDAGDVVSVTDPVLGLDGALLRISGLTIPLRPDAVWMDVRFGTRRL